MTKLLAESFNCPTEFALTVLGGKWKTVILAYLRERPCSFADLRKLLPKLSDKVLSERLRDLEATGLVERAQSRSSKRRHTYQLTPRGVSLGPILDALYHWGEEQAPSFGVDVGNPLLRLDGTLCKV